MRLQECDRPKCMAVEMSKLGIVSVATSSYSTLYVWPIQAFIAEIVAWHRDNNAGDRLIFHVDNTTTTSEMPE